MAGPWFKVFRVGDDWQRLDTITASNGDHSFTAYVEARLEFADNDTTPAYPTAFEDVPSQASTAGE